MSLKNKLKQYTQKGVRVAALVSGLSAGLASGEAKAENTQSDTVSPKESISMTQGSQYVGTIMPKNSEKLNPQFLLSQLNLIDKAGKPTFTYQDLQALEQKPQKSTVKDKPQNMDEYDEYEHQLIDKCAHVLSMADNTSRTPEEIKEKLYDVLQASGNPSLSFSKDSNSLHGSLFGRANFSPGIFGSGSIHINNEKEIIAEISHAFRDKNNVMGETGNFLLDTFKGISFTPKRQRQTYTKKGYMEHDTHSIVEPILTEYILQPMIPNYGHLEKIEDVYAMIDILRKQQKESSSIYTWTSHGDEMVSKGYQSLRNNYMSVIASFPTIKENLEDQKEMANLENAPLLNKVAKELHSEKKPGLNAIAQNQMRNKMGR